VLSILRFWLSPLPWYYLDFFIHFAHKSYFNFSCCLFIRFIMVYCCLVCCYSIMLQIIIINIYRNYLILLLSIITVSLHLSPYSDVKFSDVLFF